MYFSVSSNSYIFVFNKSCSLYLTIVLDNLTLFFAIAIYMPIKLNCQDLWVREWNESNSFHVIFIDISRVTTANTITTVFYNNYLSLKANVIA